MLTSAIYVFLTQLEFFTACQLLQAVCINVDAQCGESTSTKFTCIRQPNVTHFLHCIFTTFNVVHLYPCNPVVSSCPDELYNFNAHKWHDKEQ